MDMHVAHLLQQRQNSKFAVFEFSIEKAVVG